MTFSSCPQDQRYRLGKPLGRGALCEVVAAEDLLLGRRVALKFLPAEASAADVERFEREARLNAGLTHPNIVPVYDAGKMEDGRRFISMQLIQGRSVGALIEEGKLSLRQRLVVFNKLCDAVAYAHAHGVVHRDLKPDNVMVGSHGEVLLVDWGLARGPDGTVSEGRAGSGTQLTRVGQIMGTPYYMAPEQAQGKGRTAGPAADIYSLGALLYTLVSGLPPYDSLDLFDVVLQVSEGRYRPLGEVRPRVPDGLIRIVDRAMQLHPDDRYQEVGAMRADVRSVLVGRTRGNPFLQGLAVLVLFAAISIFAVLAGVGVVGVILTLTAPG